MYGKNGDARNVQPTFSHLYEENLFTRPRVAFGFFFSEFSVPSSAPAIGMSQIIVRRNQVSDPIDTSVTFHGWLAAQGISPFEDSPRISSISISENQFSGGNKGGLIRQPTGVVWSDISSTM